MSGYTIAAIPTLYRGRMYRSRLEARWAAFFDRLGWTHEYEPFDLGAWSPDFAITEPFDMLIEVKPITEPDPDLFKRVHGAAHASGQTAFVVGVAPIKVDNMVKVGWWAYNQQPLLVVWVRDPDRPVFYADFMSFSSDLKTWVSCTIGSGQMDDESTIPASAYADYTMGLWADASNAVQWEPRP